MSAPPPCPDHARTVWVEAQAAWRLGGPYHVSLLALRQSGGGYSLASDMHPGLVVMVSDAFAVRLVCRAMNLARSTQRAALFSKLRLDAPPGLVRNATEYRTTGEHTWAK